ncbi:MAG: hypothetical protein EP348_06135 [Alphaproteobacteria bacterium]|nr:MAG: hypothetical protein EP348_06135 [Alphaproteobacteria bacterium]
MTLHNDLMKILITRPEPDASRLLGILKKLGHEGVLAPLMTIEMLPEATVDLENLQALLVTSANGARALGKATTRRDVRVFAVGETTADAARAEGFRDVTVSGGNVEKLAEDVIAKLKPDEGRLLHVAGSKVAGDLEGLLTAAEFSFSRTILYEAKPARDLGREARSALEKGEIGAALFYSPRTAAIFENIIVNTGLSAALGSVMALCLSEAVAENLDGLSFAELRVAAKPNQENLLALLAGLPQSGIGAAATDSRGEQKVSDKNSDKTGGKSGNGDERPGLVKDPELEKILNNNVAKDADEKAAVPPKKSGAGGILLTLSLLVLIFAFGLAAWPLIYPRVEAYLPPAARALIAGRFGPEEKNSGTDTVAAITALRDNMESEYARLSARIDKLESTAANAPASESGAATAMPEGMTQEISRLSDELKDQQAKLAAALDTIKDQESQITGLKEAEPVVSGPDPATQSEILNLKNALIDAKNAMAEMKQAMAAEKDRLDGQSTELSALQEAMKANAAAKLEASVENKRTLLLLAIGQLQRETRSDQPFANGLQQVKTVAPESADATLETLQKIAGEGAPTMTALRADFSRLAPDIAQAARLPSEETWYGKTLHRIASIVKFRRVDDLEGDSADAMLARAEKDLADNDLAAAVAEMKKLSGPAAEKAQGWLFKAEQRLAVEQAISTLLDKATASAVRPSQAD